MELPIDDKVFFGMKQIIFRYLKKSFSGILILFPFIVLYLIFLYIYNVIDSLSIEIFEIIFLNRVVGSEYSSVIRILFSFLVSLTIWYIVFVSSRMFIWKIIHNRIEKIIMRFPLAWSVYKISKDFTWFFNNKPKSWKKKFKLWMVVLVEYPQRWSYVLWAVNNLDDTIMPNVVSVYIPTAPNPTSWFNVLYKKDEVKVLNITIEDMMKFILWLWAVKIDTFSENLKEFDQLKNLQEYIEENYGDSTKT